MTEWQFIIDLALGCALALIGWLARELWSAVKELREDLKNLEVNLPKEYVQKEDFKNALQEVKVLLNKIADKLDEKADKQ